MNLRARYQGLADPLRTERRVELVVVVLLVFLLLQLLLGAYRAAFPSIPDPVKPMRDSLQVQDIVGLSEATPEQRAQIRQRPLFWATRAPLEPPPPKKPKPDAAEQKQAKPGKIENVKLSGVFGTGDMAGVIVISKGKKHRVMVGEAINGWTLQSVESTSADFGSSGQLASLTLNRAEISQPVQASAQPEQSEGEKPAKAKASSDSGKGKAKAKKKTEAPDRLRLGGGDRN